MGAGSGEDPADDLAEDIGETVVAALGTIGESGVIDPEEFEHGGVDVVDVDGVFDWFVAEFVGGAPLGAALDAAAGHPDGVGEHVVVAAVALGHGGAAEFAGEDDEGIVEHAALFEVGDEGHAGAVDFGGFETDPVFDAAVVVPVFVVELDEADPAFGETAGDETVGGEGAVAGGAAVEVFDVLGFCGHVHEAGDTGLHAEGHFVLGNAGGDFGVVEGFGVLFVEIADGADDIVLEVAGVAWRVAEVEDGVAFAAEVDALEAAGEEACGPLAGGDGLVLAALAEGGEDDEAGEVFCGGA